MLDVSLIYVFVVAKLRIIHYVGFTFHYANRIAVSGCSVQMKHCLAWYANPMSQRCFLCFFRLTLQTVEGWLACTLRLVRYGGNAVGRRPEVTATTGKCVKCQVASLTCPAPTS